MVVIAHLDTGFFHLIHHLLADFVEAVEGRIGMVTLNVLATYTIQIVKIFGKGILAFAGSDIETAGKAIGIELHGIEEMIFQFRNPCRSIRYLRTFHVFMSPQRHAAWVLFDADSGLGIADGANHA